jgi:hypothetical protein
MKVQRIKYPSRVDELKGYIKGFMILINPKRAYERIDEVNKPF